tara:strand:+ start:308 stop:505 length:198 start_codon:yes stop_codon:yes gene_type:complete
LTPNDGSAWKNATKGGREEAAAAPVHREEKEKKKRRKRKEKEKGLVFDRTIVKEHTTRALPRLDP